MITNNIIFNNMDIQSTSAHSAISIAAASSGTAKKLQDRVKKKSMYVNNSMSTSTTQLLRLINLHTTYGIPT